MNSMVMLKCEKVRFDENLIPTKTRFNRLVNWLSFSSGNKSIYLRKNKNKNEF